MRSLLNNLIYGITGIGAMIIVYTVIYLRIFKTAASKNSNASINKM